MARASLAPYRPLPVHRLLERAAARWTDKIAVIDGDRQFTFWELNQYSNSFAGALVRQGVSKGDVVGILAPNCVEFEIAFFGILKAGATVTTINSGYRDREIAHQLHVSGAKILIVHHSLADVAALAAREAPQRIEMIVIEDREGAPLSLWALVGAGFESPPDQPIDPVEDLAALPFSSGTTGLQKGVMLTHANLHANVRQLSERPNELAALVHDDIVLVHLPLFHIYGMVVLQLYAISLGATQVMMGRFDMDEFLALIAEHVVSAVYTVPPVAIGLIQTPLLDRYDVSSIRFVLCGAAPLSADLQMRLADRMGCAVVQGYGLTETSPVTNADYAGSLGKPGTIGPSVADTEERVVDLETGKRDLRPNELGELLVRGPQVMKGYLNQPDATAEAIEADGWFHTGDIARMDEDGYVQIVDRKKELIKYKGFQVAPAELEALLLEHPSVADVAVIPKPDIEAGEIPKAFVVSKPGATTTTEDLMAFVATRVATFKQVRELEMIQEIPKNASGKLLRRVLVDLEAAKSADSD